MAYDGPYPHPILTGGTASSSFTAKGIVTSGATSSSPLIATSLTDGQLMIGSTGNAPVASTLTAGSNVSITNAAGSITIASTGSGSIIFLQTQTASNVPNIAFSSTFITATYNRYLVIFEDVVPVTDGVSFGMQVSTDNGATYLSTSYDTFSQLLTSAGLNQGTSTTNFVVIPATDASNTASKGISGNFYLYNLTNGTTPSNSGMVTYERTIGPGAAQAVFGGFGPGAITVNNINFTFSTGNISTGKISLYGIVS